jgi:hypothetical protein
MTFSPRRSKKVTDQSVKSQSESKDEFAAIVEQGDKVSDSRNCFICIAYVFCYRAFAEKLHSSAKLPSGFSNSIMSFSRVLAVGIFSVA